MRQIGRQLFASESVTSGHPDAAPQQISDRILDALDVGPRDVSRTDSASTSEQTAVAAAPEKDAGL